MTLISQSPGDHLAAQIAIAQQSSSGPLPFGVTLAGNASLPGLSLLDHLADLGAQWLRVNVVWNHIERTEGRYDWELLDTIVRYAERTGVQLLVQIRGYTGGERDWFPPNPLYRSSPEQKQKAYEAFLRELVRRYRGKIQYWQIENEVQYRESWTGTLEEYARVLRTASQVIKEVGGAAQVLVGAYDVSLALEWMAVDPAEARKRDWVRDALPPLQAFLRSTRGVYDILDLHLYRSPETIPQRMELVRTEMRSAGYQSLRPIWVTETGGPDTRWPYGQFPPPCGQPCTTAYQELPPEIQQSEVVKRFVLALASGVERVFWFDLGSTEPPRTFWYQMSLVRKGQRTPAFSTYQLMVRKLQGFSEVSKVPAGDGVFAARFGKPSGDVYVVWAQRAIVGSLPIRAARVVITVVAGRRTQGDPQRLSMNTSPVFVEASAE